jgi:acetyl/propionyl-CoA carboxylase alpha subunit
LGKDDRSVQAGIDGRPAGHCDSMIRSGRPFRRVLIANRGEIALRIIRACQELRVESVAVYSDADRGAAHVRAADSSVHLGPAAPAESYLRGDRIVAAALDSGAEAIHPGYGFLSERASFAQQVEAAGLAWVGPRSETIAAIGDKLAARRLADSIGVPIVPGTLEPVSIGPAGGADRRAAVLDAAAAVGYPLMVKAAAGGGGRGMRRVDGPAALEAALADGSAEAGAAFGDGSVYLEREIRPARHIEVQLLGDQAGRVVALGERDCSIQRRHQKLVEEAPAAGLSSAQRGSLHELAVRLASAAGLSNAATAEFLLDETGRFWFLEVNARLQVEHGVTELVSGIDIVTEQLWLASGAALSAAVLAAAERAGAPAGHAIEVRISQEDPARGFSPTSGRVGRFRQASGPGVRVDTAIEPGDQVPPDYDPLLAKLMVHAADRPAAIDRLRRALDETEIGGVQTTLPFHRFVARSPAFAAVQLSTDFVADHWAGPASQASRADALGQALLGAGLAEAVSASPPAAGHPPARGRMTSGRPSPWRAARLGDQPDDPSQDRPWGRPR